MGISRKLAYLNNLCSGFRDGYNGGAVSRYVNKADKGSAGAERSWLWFSSSCVREKKQAPTTLEMPCVAEVLLRGIRVGFMVQLCRKRCMRAVRAEFTH